MKGIKPISEQEKLTNAEEEVKIFRIPPDMFKEFEEIDDNNETSFEYIAFKMVIEYLNNTCGLETSE
jgi:hypothetical protein